MYKNILENMAKNNCSDVKSEKELLSNKQIKKIMVDTLLKKHEENKNIPLDVLVKSWKKAFTNGVTVLGLLHGAHYMNNSNNIKTQEQKQADTKQIEQARVDARNEGQSIIDKNLGKDGKIKSFLDRISMIESSGGKNMNHKRMEHGIHAGDAAIGKYGFMPNTVKEMANRMGKDHPLNSYSQMDNAQIEKQLAQNPEHQDKFANHLANHLHDKFGGEEHKMAYSWNQGHNLTPEHFENKHKDYKNHDYVKKYSNLSKPTENKGSLTSK